MLDIYSSKATKFCEIFPLLLTTVHTVKSKGKISQNFVAFSEYVNFKFQSLRKFGLILDIFYIYYFIGGTKEKIQKTCQNQPKLYIVFFGVFPLVPPKNENKSCLNELLQGFKNPKSSICWKFQLSISCESKKSPSTIQLWTQLKKPLRFPL